MFLSKNITLLVLSILSLLTRCSALTHAQAMSRLTSSGIRVVSSGNCSNRNNPNCTSLDGVRENTIAGLQTLKRASNCDIIVTGGTETGHGNGSGRSHWNGYKADVRLNSCINSYIERSFAYAGVRSDGSKLYRSAAGNVYAREGNHWDILYI